VNLQACLLLASALFCLGIFGILTRRNAVGILISVELLANAININFVSFAYYLDGVSGQVFAVFAIALTVAEAVIGLALVILLYRAKKEIAVDVLNEMRH
jgi:NADH:ubiquinone oxidoreductase subunit K